SPPGARGRLHRLLPWNAADPRRVCVGARSPGATHRSHFRPVALYVRDHRLDARLHGVRDGGVPRGNRVRASESAHGGALAPADLCADAAPRCASASDPAGRPAAPERLHRLAEGHRDHHRDRRHRSPGSGQFLLQRHLPVRRLHGRRCLLRHPHDPLRPLYGPPDQRTGAARAGPTRVNSADGHFVALEGVIKRFDELTVLQGIDLTVDLHQVVCLIGASGSGKSTLLRCVNLLEVVDEGTIVVDGETITNGNVDTNALRRKIGIVFQAFNLFPHMTVMQNITLAPRKARGLSKAEAHSAARDLLGRIGLLDKADEYPDRLSGGQQQRVAIARALAMNPTLLLLDEITSALDPQLVSEVLSLVRELAKTGMTMIIATHEMSFAREVADKVCFLDRKSVV